MPSCGISLFTTFSEEDPVSHPSAIHQSASLDPLAFQKFINFQLNLQDVSPEGIFQVQNTLKIKA